MSISCPKRFARSVLTGALLLAASSPSFAQLKFSEMLFNPTGVPVGQETIEIRNTTAFPINLFGFSLMIFDGNPGNPGVLLDSLLFSPTTVIPANGLLLIRDSATSLSPPPGPNCAVLVNDFAVDLGTGSNTLVLGFGVAVAGGTDIDFDNDGKSELVPLSSVQVVDAVGIVDSAIPGGVGYGDDYGGSNIGPYFGPFPAAHSPDAIYRIFNADGTPCTWIGGDITGSFPGPFAFDVSSGNVFGFLAEGVSTLSLDLGAQNYVPDLNGNGVANSCDNSLIFEGLAHQRLGGGLIQYSGPDLQVGSVGPLGGDGVVVATGRGETHVIDFENAGPALLPTGATQSITAVGTVLGVPNQNAWTLSLEDVGTEFALRLNTLFLNPNALRVESLLNGALVQSKNYIAPLVASSILATFDSARIEVVPFAVVVASSPDEIQARIRLPAPIAVDIQTGGGAFQADEIVLRAFGPQYYVEHINGTKLTGASLGSFVIHAEEVGIFGHPHASLGAATFAPDNDRLDVDHHVLAGTDGVEIDLGDMVRGTQLGFKPVDMEVSGAAMSVDFDGSLQNVSGQPLFRVGIANVAGNVSIALDGGAFPASTFDLQVLDDGDLVGSFPFLYSSPTTVASITASGLGTRAVRYVTHEVGANPATSVLFTERVTITPVSGSPLVGDQFRVVGNGVGTVDAIQRAIVHGTNIGRVSLDCEAGFNIDSYGTGCTGSGGYIPRLRIDGCAQVDQVVRVRVDRCFGGSVGLLLFGVAPSATPLGFAPGCTLNAFPIYSIYPLFLGGTGPGAGSIEFTGTVPYYGAGYIYPLQIANFDFGANPLGVSLSNGVLIRFDP